MITFYNIIGCVLIASLVVAVLGMGMSAATQLTGIILAPSWGYMLLASFAAALLTVVMVVARNK